MATQTGSYDFKAAKEAHDDAAKKASNYLTDITGGGVYVHKEDDDWSEATGDAVKITDSAVEILQGGVNVAEFGASGAQIGQNGGAHSIIDANGQRFFAMDGVTQLANIGYGESTTASGTADQPYFSFGKRATTSTPYSTSSTYKVGDLCLYNNKVYVCKTDITTAEAWNNSHWQLAIGGNSIADGLNNVASGIASHAEGTGTRAIGHESHAEGMMTPGYKYVIASGEGSHAEGGGTIASGRFAHAEGSQTQAIGGMSHAQNVGTIAGSYAQTAIGYYNVKDSNDSYLFIIGNGTDATDAARSNALTVDWSGNVNIASGAKYKINGTNLAASDVGAVPTTRKVNNKALSADITLSASDVGALASADLYTRSSAGGLDWSSATANKIIAKSALAFWNGSYDGTTSWLTRCKTGEIIGSQGGTMTGQLKTSFKTSVAMGSYESAQATVNGLAEEVRFSSGCAGSANITTAYTKDGVTIPTGWYNFMYMPHRSGGKNGAADGDNAQYGNLFLFGMNNTNGRFVVRVTSGAIAEVVKLVTTADIATSKGTTSITTTGGSLVTHSIARNGKMRTLFLRVKNSSAINAGSNVYTGTIATASDRPAVWANGLGYYNGAAILFQIKDDGAITARNTAQQLPANGEVYASLTYVVS